MVLEICKNVSWNMLGRFLLRVRTFYKSCWNVLRDVLECFLGHVRAFHVT